MSASSTRGPRRTFDRAALLGVFASPLLPEAIPFQDPIDEICARPAPRYLRGTHYLALALFLSLLAVAAITRVDIVVVAPGRLVTATPPIVLQPMERAIVRELNVRPGDPVVKGQVLATLDPTFAQADTAALRKQSDALSSRVRRLQAETSGAVFEAGVAAGADELLQATLFRQRQAEYAARLHVYDEDIARLQAGLRTLAGGRDGLGREVGVAQQVEDIRSTLLQSQTGSKLNLLEAEATRLRAQRDQLEATDRLDELRHSLQSRIAERQAFVDEWHRELLESLVTAQTELARTTSELTKAVRLQDLVVVTSPADGVVLDVAPRTEGSVLREAEPMFTIVPKDATMVAEVTIASADVGFTSTGADVQLKIDAFPYQRHGMASGRLQSVSEESFSPGGVAGNGARGAVHRGRVELTGMQLDHMPAGARLFPGMTLTAEIKAGSRSVLAYFLYPLSRGLSESVREP